MSSNKHQRLKQLEKLAAIAKVKNRATAESQAEKEIQAKVAAYSDEELKALYETTMEEIRNKPPNPDLEGLTTSQIIEKCQQLCKED